MQQTNKNNTFTSEFFNIFIFLSLLAFIFYLLVGAGKIILKGSRHPCLEAQDDIGFIANDVSLVKGNLQKRILSQ